MSLGLGPVTALSLNLAYNLSCMPSSLALSLAAKLAINFRFILCNDDTVFLKWRTKARNIHINPNISQNTTRGVI